MEIDGFYREVVLALNAHEVEFLLVGGLAVGFHGYSRYTGDMDLWLNPTEANLERLGKALKSLGYSPGVIKTVKEERPLDHPTPIRLIEEKGQFKVDLMTNIYHDKLKFQTCLERAEKCMIDEMSIPVLNIRDLIELKSNVNRVESSMKDLVDADELKRILNERIEQSKQIEKSSNIIRKFSKGKNKE